MSKKKKNGNKNSKISYIVLITASLQLISAIIHLVEKLIE